MMHGQKTSKQNSNNS